MPAARKSAASPASRAAQLLAAQRKAKPIASSSSLSGSSSASASASEEDEDKPLPLPQLIQALTASKTLSTREALPIAACLVRAKLHTPKQLAMLSPMALQDAGVETEEVQRKVCAAFGRGKRRAPKAHLNFDDRALARAYGNVGHPDTSSSRHTSSSSNSNFTPVHVDYSFNPVLDATSLRGRYLNVNRAPVLCAWCVVLATRLGFNTREALSLAQCYVAITARARGVAIGKLKQSDQAPLTAGSSQPHFLLMDVRIPLMQLADGEWRGINEGVLQGPDKAFEYLRTSMRQLLPHVMGALELLADSWLAPTPAQLQPGETQEQQAQRLLDELHAKAFRLYADFRPETHGEWGKKEKFELDKVLRLRKVVEEVKEEEQMEAEASRPEDEGAQPDSGVKDEPIEVKAEEEDLAQQGIVPTDEINMHGLP